MGYLHKERVAPVLALSRNGSGPTGELSREDLRAAELGFRQLLRRKRFPAAFLSRHAADLLAQARLEYVRHFAGGDEIDNAPGWIIHCAWRRTQNLLEREKRASRAISASKGGETGVQATTPEDEVMEADRHRKVQEAIGGLTLEERKVIALTYFEGLSVREASRTLGWDKCKGDRRHNSALAHLYDLLGVEDAEALQIETGAAAWASLLTAKRMGPHLPPALHAAFDAATRATVELMGRGGELVRRVLGGGGGDGGMGAAAGAGARAVEMSGGGILAACTAGVCGAATLACLATGVLGPGLGGIDAHSQPERPAARRAVAAPAPAQPAPSPLEATGGRSRSSAANRRKSARGPRRARAALAKHRGTRRPEGTERVTDTPVSTPMTSPRQVEEEFDPLAEGSEPSAESPPASSGPTRSRPTGAEGTPPPPPASGKQVEAEFGF